MDSEDADFDKSKCINYNDPRSWPQIDDKVRCFLIERGPEQGKNCDFRFSMTDDGRTFSADWFQKTLSNNEKIERKWLIYSKNAKSIFCFPCLLFGTKETIFSKGFRDWKHLNPRIGEHENSAEHRKCYVTWKEMEMRLIKGKTLDDELQRGISAEKEKWRYILKVIIDVVLFCAKNNLALRGGVEKIGHRKSGIFLSTVELLAKHNLQMKEHVSSITKGSLSYFSPTIQNEVISALGSAVKNKIMAKILQAKYYSISFDCTPDISHQEQMSEIVRYVDTNNGKCTVEESFLAFIKTDEKTGSGLTDEIVNKLSKDGLILSDCRGQSYDNGANMAGKYQGVQARILQLNEHARFLPCSAHSLNLVGVHASCVTPEMTTFFGTVQNIFNYFSGSIERWQALSNLKLTLKGHSDTRWSSKYHSIHSLHTQLPQIIKILHTIGEGSDERRKYTADSVSSAKSILKMINFEFICLLVIWDHILRSIDNVNRILQEKTVSIEVASKHLQGLVDFLNDFRKNQIELCIDSARNLANELSIEPEFSEKRKRKVKTMFDERAKDNAAIMTPLQKFKIQLYCVLDTLIQQMGWRFQSLAAVAYDFGFLIGLSLHETSTEELKKSAADLALKYKDDLNANELCLEIESYKHQIKSLLPDLKNADYIALLNCHEEYGLVTSYPNIGIALRLALTLPVTSASCERSLSKLKLIKNYLRSQIGQERLSNLAILSIEYDIAKSIDVDHTIDKLASEKARKVNF